MNYKRLALVACPDRYGRFAHQTFSLLSAWSVAHALGCYFIPVKYAYFANKFNDHVSFEDSALARSQFTGEILHQSLPGVTPDSYGNTKYDLLDKEQSISFISDLAKAGSYSADSVILHLPFDQHPGRFLKNLTPAMADDLTRIFQHLFQISRKDAELIRGKKKSVIISIHIRRGDITPKAHPDWYIDDRYYEHLIEGLYYIFGDMLRIRILVQGGISWGNTNFFNMLYSKQILSSYVSSGGWLNTDDVSDFSWMLNSDIIIAGQSGFSLLASLLSFGKAQIVVTRTNVSRIPQAVTCSDRINATSDLCSLDDAIATLNKCSVVKEFIQIVG